MIARPVSDAAVRERALDPARSFIVQAPAGAGKTALLIQRFLRLLATVRRPEEILAITFTRKAAGEMKRRVLEALQAAGQPLPAEAGDNERRTRALAQAALARDAERGWCLLENTARLRIQTIDSFNASLTRQMPVLAHLGWQPALVEDARDLHHEAAVRTLALLDGDAAAAPAVERLLAHLDGDQGKVASLVAAMLARRDQWLQRGMAGDIARADIEDAFRRERAGIMARASHLLPAVARPRLLDGLSHAAGELDRLGIDSPILACAGLAALPAADESGARAWEAIAGLLLTAEGGWRKKVNKSNGFPAKKDGGQEAAKRAFESLLEDLQAEDGLRQALADLLAMPPAAFSDPQWEALEAVAAVLPIAAAQLLLVFAERGEVDHPQIAAGAVRALGEEDSPTDLMLALDERLSHILVDEFQDTSRSQWKLLAALTAGWTPDDGRTVFAVGDPMQSIYRFREANVGLFLRAWREGLPRVRLETLRLTTNFRSSEGIVAWVNAAFRHILPARDDAAQGAVSFAPSEAFHGPREGEAVTWHAFVDDDRDRARSAEARRVADLVRAARSADPEGSVAILVRNRTHLAAIVPVLREAGLRFRAVDIEGLGERQGVLDLVALTRALAHAADRAAWLAVLRAPWCGLSLADLLALAGDDDRAVPDCLADEARLAAVPTPGRERLARVAAVLLEALAQRLRGTLRERVERTWLRLGGPACLADAAALADAETYFDRLDEIAEADDLADPARLEAHLEDLYGAPDLGAREDVQLMTIHKAKGLEFGTVIVPGLDRLPRTGDAPLFRWKARADGTLLMAPVKEAARPGDPAYDYLRTLESREEGHEVERLLYVAATRAVGRLHLLGRVGVEEADGEGTVLRAPAARSLLGKAWVVARREFEGTPRTVAGPAGPAPAAGGGGAQDLRWVRPEALAVSVPPPAFEALPPPREAHALIAFDWAGETLRQVGTVAHRWLQRIAEEGLAAWNADRARALRPAVLRELERRGVMAAEREAAAAHVVAALAAAVTDERGRWVLGDHPQSASELRLDVLEDGRIRTVVMDRVFTDANGVRWIVDFKTSRHEGGDPEAFLDAQRERYAEQMRRYARALGGESRLGLYFPLLPGWREVAA